MQVDETPENMSLLSWVLSKGNYLDSCTFTGGVLELKMEFTLEGCCDFVLAFASKKMIMNQGCAYCTLWYGALDRSYTPPGE